MTGTTADGDVLLRVAGVGKTYRAAGRSVTALAGVELDVRAGEFVSVVGPSGGGKTTLLKIVAGLLPATEGQVVLDGRPVREPPERLGVVFQEYGRSLFAWKTVRANVELPLRHRVSDRAERRRLVAEALADVGLADAGDAYPWQLSGGMQQRVAIARALAHRPRLLLMDEPFSAVDAQTRADLEDLLATLWRRYGITVVFVTHDIDEAVYLGQRVVVLSAAPARVTADIAVDLPAVRDQLTTRSDPRFAELRARVYGHVRRPPAAPPSAEPAEPAQPAEPTGTTAQPAAPTGSVARPESAESAESAEPRHPRESQTP
ncbi:ABC transporter ATP-binding protein [Streptomyces sp. DSM 44915]|uniref:ABC transporter ATP-binding protein n=1 Tax=Streptomyces chisholmiae TaxID=3075540 RepID=A0ABU2JPP8_9ACTN|nr:ABC transporter ATP-binding protein [Streptomyces sp. DSM 44915]MDT0266706.1 ABC transporter ATP-binding protein [Streptomyces sp. DSM 44915]